MMPDEHAVRAAVDDTFARYNLSASEEDRVRMVKLLPELLALANRVRVPEAEHGEAAFVFGLSHIQGSGSEGRFNCSSTVRCRSSMQSVSTPGDHSRFRDVAYSGGVQSRDSCRN